MTTDERLISERFPRASAYHPEWVLGGVSGGANALWLTEWLCEGLDLRPGMRVLDLGCGRALSSIFLNREFGVEVWATDLWFSASENIQRVRDAGAHEGVFPIAADARSLPFSEGFFDAVVSIDSFMFYGTDDLYLNYLAQLREAGRPRGNCDSPDFRAKSTSQSLRTCPSGGRAKWRTACTPLLGGGNIGSAAARWTLPWPTPSPRAGGSGVIGSSSWHQKTKARFAPWKRMPGVPSVTSAPSATAAKRRSYSIRS